MLDSCCISIGLLFIKDRPVSSFWVLRFRDLGVFVFEFWVLRFRDRVLRFRVLGASFLRFGCFVLRSSFSRAPFSKLPLNPSASNVHTQAKSKRKHKCYVYVSEATDQETTEKNNALEADDGHGSRPKRKRKERHVVDI